MKRTILAVAAAMVFAAGAYAAFEDMGWTARSKALGNAIFAEFDGINSMNYNPATIAMARGVQFYADWSSPYMGLNDGTGLHVINANFLIPFWNKFTLPFDGFFTKRGAIAFSFRRFSVWGDPGTGQLTELYHEGVYSFFYGKDLNDFLSRGAKISAGIKVSLYDIGVAETEDTLANPAFQVNGVATLGKISFGLDAGLTYDFSESIRLGLVYKNIVAPNVSILQTGNDTLASELRLGANWAIGDLLFLKKSSLGGGMVMYFRGGLEGTNDNRQSDTSYNVGFEFKQLSAGDLIKGSQWKGEMLSVRFGGIYQPRTAPLESIITVSGGMGFTYVFGKEHQFTLDYTVEYGINSQAFKQAAGLMYQILLPNSAFAYKEEVRKELEFEELIKKKAEDNTQTNDTSVTNTTSTNKKPR